jgi:hypothetical protein
MPLTMYRLRAKNQFRQSRAIDSFDLLSLPIMPHFQRNAIPQPRL